MRDSLCRESRQARPREPDGADEDPHRPFLVGEDEFDSRGYRRFARIGPTCPLLHGMPQGLLAMDGRDEAVWCEHRLVLRPVLVIRQVSELSAIVSGGVCRAPTPYRAVPAVDGNMVLIAERRHGDIDLLRAVLTRIRTRDSTVQRASRPFCRAFPGLSRQAGGISPALIATHSASMLHCLGAATIVESTICPPMVR